MLQAFTGQTGASGYTADEKAPRTGIGRSPHQIARALEAKHGVEKIKRYHIQPMGVMRSAGSDKFAHAARLSDPLFEYDSILFLTVVQQGIFIDGLIFCACRGVDPHLLKERLKAKSA